MKIHIDSHLERKFKPEFQHMGEAIVIVRGYNILLRKPPPRDKERASWCI
jgi:hypothetical protein